MKTKTLLHVLIVLLFILGAAYSMGQKDPCTDPDEQAVFQSAQRGLAGLVEGVPQSELVIVGFRNPDEIGWVTFGKPLRIYTILPKKLEAYPTLQSMGEMLTPTDEFIVPLLVESEYRLLMILDRIGGRWKAVGLTDKDLAAELGVFFSRWPLERKTLALPDDTAVKFVRVYQAEADLMMIQGGGREFVHPFQSARMAIQPLREGLLIPAEVLPQLKIAVLTNSR